MSGIGGRTISEAKRNLSYNEYLVWLEFRKKYGSLNIARRVEHSVGFLEASLYAVNGAKKVKPIDFMRNEPKPKEKEEDFLEKIKRFAGV